MAAPWIAVDITMPQGVAVSDELFGTMTALLFELGAQGTENQDTADPVVVVAAFPPSTEVEGLAGTVASALAEAGMVIDSARTRLFDDVDWSTHWREHFSPLDFGRLWVVPSWLEPPAQAEQVLRIDPSMAFGTGLHETTALCLERIIELSPVESMLDMGCGTGILALAALKFGARRALGVDNDPDALVVAAENAEVNGVKLGAAGLELSGVLDDARFALVVANILAGPLITLAAKVVSAVAPGGKLLLSGVLGTQADEVRAAYEAQGARWVNTKARGEWVCIELGGPGSGS